MDLRGRVIGIDFGTRRVGLAMSDPLQLTAQPLGTFAPDAALDKLRDVAREEEIERFVVGWPLLADGTIGESAERVQGFVQRVQLQHPDVEIVKWNEEYTSAIARSMLAERGAKIRRRNRGRIDQLAAAIILQEYLDSS